MYILILYYNIITADDMGLGKTITMIALVVSDKETIDHDDDDDYTERKTRCECFILFFIIFKPHTVTRILQGSQRKLNALLPIFRRSVAIFHVEWKNLTPRFAL